MTVTRSLALVYLALWIPTIASGDGAISGVVTNESGSPVVGVWVDAYDASTNLVWSDYTAADGSYTITPLPAGSYYVRTDVFGENYIDEWYDDVVADDGAIPVYATPVVVTDGVTTPGISFGLEEGAQVSGTVTDAAGGAPLSNVWVDAYNAGGARVGSDLTSTNGTYTISGLLGGVYTIGTDDTSLTYADEWYDNVPVSGFEIPDDAKAIVLLSGESETGIDFQLEKGVRFSGSVTNNVALPLDGIWIDAYNEGDEWVDSAQTDTNGAYALAGLSPGVYRIRTYSGVRNLVDEWYDDIPVVGGNISPLATELNMAAGSSVSNLDFTLSAGAIVSGMVTDTNASPLQDVGIDIYTAGNVWQAGADTDTNGVYTVSRLPAGLFFARTYVANLNLVDEWYDDVEVRGGTIETSAAPLHLTAGAITNGVDFVLAAGGGIAGTVTATGGTALAGITVAIYSYADSTWFKSAVTGTNGSYSVQGLPTGAYAARTFADRMNYADEWHDNIPYLGNSVPTNATPTDVVAGTTVGGIDFALEQGATVSGLVTDTALTPLAGIEIAAYTAEGTEVMDAVSAYDGTYVLSRLPAATFYLRAKPSGINYVSEWYDNIIALGFAMPSNATPVMLAPASATGGVDFALAAGGSVTGNVTDSLSSPLAGISIDLYDGNTNWVASTSSEPDGSFIIVGLQTPAAYYARAYDYTADHAGQWYESQPIPYAGIPVAATPVAVSTAAPPTAVNFTLSTAGQIAGMVADAAGSRLADITLLVYDPAGTLMQMQTTSAAGDYFASRLSPGPYYIRALPDFYGFREEWYDDLPVQSERPPLGAVSVTVSEGTTTAPVDFQLGFYVVDAYLPGDSLRILWQAAIGTTYQVRQSDDLLIWTNAPSGTSAVQQSLQTAAAQDLLEYRLPAPPEPRMYYRVEIVP